jgi:integrase
MVPLFPAALGALRKIFELVLKNDRGLVFANAAGGMYAVGHDFGWEDVKDQRAKGGVRPGARSRLGIKRKVRFHDLRHSCASHLVMGTWGRRWSIEEVSKFLGHSDIQVTQRYAHLADTALHRAAEMTANLPKICPRPSSEDAPSTSRHCESASDDSELRTGAGNGIRTHDLQHGKLSLYH